MGAGGEPKGWCTVVTGATGGIGRAVVARLTARGKCVLAVGRDMERLRAAFTDNAKVISVACDIATPDCLEVLASAIKEHFDGVEGFVHAAGFDIPSPMNLVRADDMLRLFAIHAVFPLQFLGWLSKRGNYAPSASAVLISSCATREGAKGHAAYAAAKGAVEGMLKCAAAELAQKGLRLNAVVLGVVDTAMSQAWIRHLSPPQHEALVSAYPLGLGKPDDAASAIEFLLSADSAWITGQTLVCDGGKSLA